MIDFSLASYQNIFTIGDGKGYIELNNTVGQKWLIPLKKSKIHLSLFQPSSLNGKLVLLLFNIIKYFPFILKRINAKTIKLDFSPQFTSFIDTVFDSRQCEISIFCGSPGKHQKLTMLVICNDSILGYCKLSEKECVKELFVKESESLNFLHSKGVDNVPESLYCGNLSFCKSIAAFIQTTKRNNSIKIATYNSSELFEFVDDLNTKTKQVLNFNDSDFAKSLNRLFENLHLLRKIEKIALYRKAIRFTKNYFRESADFCVFHGDLTPWNSFIVDGKLFAFDWEYIKMTYPPWCNYFHFFTQELLYNANADANQIYSCYNGLKNSKLAMIKDCDMLYLSYLLIISDFYLDRDGGILNQRVEKCFDIWLILIKYLIDDAEKNYK